MMAATRPASSAARLDVETIDAWFDYLYSTRGLSELRYCEVEPWAWARLQQRLRAIDARRQAIA